MNLLLICPYFWNVFSFPPPLSKTSKNENTRNDVAEENLSIMVCFLLSFIFWSLHNFTSELNVLQSLLCGKENSQNQLQQKKKEKNPNCEKFCKIIDNPNWLESHWEGGGQGFFFAQKHQNQHGDFPKTESNLARVFNKPNWPTWWGFVFLTFG